MWLFKKLIGGDTKYLIAEKHSYSVGRKNSDITFEEDSSVSRKHCTIYISKRNECPFPVNTITGIWIVDEQSKYGTFLSKNREWVKINPNQNEKLSDGSVIRFGLMENIYRVEYKPVTACVSGIPTEQKKEIESALKLIDGELSNTWRKDCSLVVVNEINLTVKVVLALINGVPIVLPQYIQKLVESIENQIPPPDHQSFRPDIKETVLKTSLISLDPKDNRKELFKGKKFLIPTKRQLETLKEIITSAGGQIELLSCTSSWERFTEENVIVIQIPMNDTAASEKLRSTFKEISAFLKNSNRRVVPESEIAQAVAYASIKKYCNPESGSFSLRQSQREIDPGSVLIDETPEASTQSILGSYLIPSSSKLYSPNISNINKVQSQKSVTGRKRTHSPEMVEPDCSKKKAANRKKSDEGSVCLKNSEPELAKETSTESGRNSTKTKKNSSKNSRITSYFGKEIATPVVEPPSTPQPPKGDKSREGDVESNKTEASNPPKRKLSDETNSEGGSSSRKKTRRRYPEEEAQAKGPENQVDMRVNVKETWQPAKKVVQDDDDLAGFIEKDATDPTNTSVDELNQTILSLQLVPSAFLNTDKSLVDPPHIPANIKKFKKRGVEGRITALERAEETLSGGDWVQPHFLEPHFAVFVGDD